MQKQPNPCAVLFVEKVERMTQFYQALAAFDLILADPDHAVLELAGWQLVLHTLPGSEVTPNPPQVREDSYHKLCFPVASIAAVRERVAVLGGLIYPPDREWSARGFRACDGYDPEGNVIQVRELAV